MSTDEENVVVTVVDPLVAQLASVMELVDSITKANKQLTSEMKVLTKDVNKLRLAKTPKGKKAKAPVDPDAPKRVSALEKPVKISDELSKFLGFTVGEEVSRQKVTTTINKYVKDNDLQNPENRRYILLETKDAGLKLKALLRDPDQPLTFFNIQRYLKPHYPASVAAAAAAAAAASAATGTSVDVSTPKEVVKDDAVVDESPREEAPKKKVVRRVVKKTE